MPPTRCASNIFIFQNKLVMTYLNRLCCSFILQQTTNLGPKQASHALVSTQRRYKSNARPSATYIEISGAVGGSESMLFAAEMLDMYLKYFKSMQWPFRIEEETRSDIGGIQHTKVIVLKDGSFECLIQEGGVHRVQRVPKTEKAGRIHTSTITVSIIPQSVMDLRVEDRDLEITTMRSSGPGGQHVNKTESAVRILHKPSGIATDAQITRSQLENKKIAMDKLIDKLKSLEIQKLTSKSESLRRSQVGSANRNEKIRTYNFPQDRVTDHRINKSYSGLRRLMSGDMTLLTKLIQDYHADKS